MSQEFVTQHMTNEHRIRIDAISEILEGLENIPNQYNATANITPINIKFALSSYSMLISAVFQKSFQLLHTHSKQVTQDSIKQLSEEFLNDQIQIKQTFEDNIGKIMQATLHSNDTGTLSTQQIPVKQTQYHSNKINQDGDQNQDDEQEHLSNDNSRYELPHMIRNDTGTNFKENYSNDLDLSESSDEANENPINQLQEQKSNKKSVTEELNNAIDTSEQKAYTNTPHLANKKLKLSSSNEQNNIPKQDCCIPRCQNKYENWNGLSKHLRQNHRTKDNKCQICTNRIFDDWKSLLQHYKFNHVFPRNN